MDMDNIIEKMRERYIEISRTHGNNSEYYDYGYNQCLSDLIYLVEKESQTTTPPCTGSSVNKTDTEKLCDFCETLKVFSKEVNDKNKKLHEWITYDIGIGDSAELKDGTVGKINYAGKLKRHDKYEWYFVIGVEEGKSICLYSYDLSKDFKQIGRYNFYSEDKQSKIDKLKLSITKESVPVSKVEFKANGEMLFIADSMETIFKKKPPTNEQLMDKINEIIDVINGMKGDR